MRFAERLRGLLHHLLSLRDRSSRRVGRLRESLSWHRLRFSLERWRLEETFTSEAVRVEGWCVAAGGRGPARLRLRADERIIEEIVCDGERADVAEALGRSGGAARYSGFAVLVRIPDHAGALRLEYAPDGRVLVETRVDVLRKASLCFAVETFRLEPAGSREQLRAEGWCYVPGEAAPVTLRLVADGHAVGEIPCGTVRDDVPRLSTNGSPRPSGFSGLFLLPAPTAVVRLETVPDRRVLVERRVEELGSLRFEVESFAVEPFAGEERLRVEGWCYARSRTAPVELRLSSDGRPLAEIRCAEPREDIQRTFAEWEKAGATPLPRCGFFEYVTLPPGVRSVRLESPMDRVALAEAPVQTLRAASLRFEVEAFGLRELGASERLHVEGWCYARGRREPVRLRLSVDGRALREIRCGRVREDVVRKYGLRETRGVTSLPECGFVAKVVVPPGARTIRLESTQHHVVLAERDVEAMFVYRHAVEIFRVDPPIGLGAPPLLSIAGWLYGRGNREVGQVTIQADGVAVRSVDCGIERPDVEQVMVWLDRRDATSPLRYGFRAQLPLPPADTLRLVAPDGSVLAERRREALLEDAGLLPSGRFVSTPETRWAAHVENNVLRPHVSEMLANAAARLARRPTFAILVAIVSEDDLPDLETTARSLAAQVYPDWELSVAAPSALRGRLDRRDVLASLGDTYRLRVASGTRLADAAAAATAEWLCVLGPGDRLASHALFAAADALQEGDVDLLYGDEDVLDENGARREPSFKPVWSPTRLLSQDYVGRPAFVRRITHDAAGGFRDGEHALWLRLGYVATVRRLSGILCHRKPAPRPDPVAAVASHLTATGARLSASPGPGGVAIVDGPDEGPSVEIVIPTRNRADLLRLCLRSLDRTRYRPFRVTVVDDHSDDAETLSLLADARAGGIKVIRVEDPAGFSFARLNNLAVAESDAELVLLLNNDTEVRDPRWLSRMVALLSAGVGAVGARLLYPDGTVQHAGVLLRSDGLAPGHELAGWPGRLPSPGGLVESGREVSAVTGACLLTPRAAWQRAGGLDESFRVSLNDVDYCLRLADYGLRTVYAGSAELVHHESASRGRTQDPAELAAFRRRYARRRDSYHSPNLEGGYPVPECRLDFARHKEAPLRVAIDGATWEAEVVREALTAVGSSRRIELLQDGAEVVIATGPLGYRAVDRALEAGLPALWAHGGPLEPSWRWHHLPREEEPSYRRALSRVTAVVFGSAEARDRSRYWQTRENFLLNPVAVPELAALQPPDSDSCRVVWVGEGTSESDPSTFLRAVHRLDDRLPFEASWLCWGEGACEHPRVLHAGERDRRAARRLGRRVGPTGSATLDAFARIDVFVSTGTGWDDPRPLLHATRRGAAILAPSECGVAERTAIGINAWTYPIGDAKSLAARLDALIRDPTRRKVLQRRSCDVFGCLWSFEEMTARWADLVWAAWHRGPSEE